MTSYGRNLTATFSGGYILDVNSGSGGAVTVVPDKALYQPGETVTLTAVPDAGHMLYRWGTPVVVRSGASFTNASGILVPPDMVHAEAGAMVSANSVAAASNIFAEDGAIIDFGSGGGFHGSLFHSPETTLLGTIPQTSIWMETPLVREVTSLRPSYGIGPFAEGWEVVASVEGPGTVARTPEDQFVRYGTEIHVTATLAAGVAFVRWIGGPASNAPVTSFRAYRNGAFTGRFSDRPDFFTTWRADYFTVAELSDPTISGLNANPDGEQLTNSAEYAFGRHPKIRDYEGIRMAPSEDSSDRARATLTYMRPTLAADVNYILNVSSDLSTWVPSSDSEAWFQIEETGATPLGGDMERISVEISSEEDLPITMYFTISAEVL